MISGWTPEEIREYITALWEAYTAMLPVDEQKKGKEEKKDATRTSQG
jgi:hypothetical protein